MLPFDHLKLIEGDLEEMKRFRSMLMGMLPGVVDEWGVLHEHDGSCCHRENWNATAARIVASVKPPTRIALVNLPPE